MATRADRKRAGTTLNWLRKQCAGLQREWNQRKSPSTALPDIEKDASRVITELEGWGILRRQLVNALGADHPSLQEGGQFEYLKRHMTALASGRTGEGEVQTHIVRAACYCDRLRENVMPALETDLTHVQPKDLPPDER